MKFVKLFFTLFSENKITQASAALAYYLTMTFFPVLIVLFSIAGQNRENIYLLLSYGEKITVTQLMEIIQDFILYVEEGDFRIMLPFGITALFTYASAALRTLQKLIFSIQGGAEYKGIKFFIISMVYSAMMLFALYFAVSLMLFGRKMLFGLTKYIPSIFKWIDLSYVILAVLLTLIMAGIYHLPKRSEDRYSIFPGAVTGSIGFFLVSPTFSLFIGRSIKYSLVYGSMASFVLLMIWLYACCLILCSGALLNICLYKIKKPQD